MKTDSSAQRRRSVEYGAVSDANLYAHHLRMLSRYGIGYICEHPEVLFDPVEVPRTDPNRGMYGTTSGSPYDALFTEREKPHSSLGDRDEGLVGRLNQAYQILNEIYAPQQPVRAGRHGYRRRYGRSPSSMPSRPGTYRRAYR